MIRFDTRKSFRNDDIFMLKFARLGVVGDCFLVRIRVDLQSGFARDSHKKRKVWTTEIRIPSMIIQMRKYF